MSNAPKANPKAVIRYSLTLSGIAMVIFAGLTFSGIIGLPPLVGYLFLAVAAMDVLIAQIVFKD